MKTGRGREWGRGQGVWKIPRWVLPSCSQYKSMEHPAMDFVRNHSHKIIPHFCKLASLHFWPCHQITSNTRVIKDFSPFLLTLPKTVFSRLPCFRHFFHRGPRYPSTLSPSSLRQTPPCPIYFPDPASMASLPKPPTSKAGQHPFLSP